MPISVFSRLWRHKLLFAFPNVNTGHEIIAYDVVKSCLHSQHKTEKDNRSDPEGKKNRKSWLDNGRKERPKSIIYDGKEGRVGIHSAYTRLSILLFVMYRISPERRG